MQNILCLTGDDVSQGDHPQAKPVFDLDAVSLLHIARGMCDQGQYASGRKLEMPPDLFIGATANPFVPPYRDRVANLEKKIVAGARFIQTQFCFDVGMFEDFMQRGAPARTAPPRQADRRRRHVGQRQGAGVDGRACAGRARAAQPARAHRQRRRISGSKASACASRSSGPSARIEGVAGVHVMGHRNEDVLAEIIVESGIGPRGRISRRSRPTP